MLDFVLALLMTAYALIIGLLIIYSLNYFYLTIQAMRASRRSLTEPKTPLDEWPCVTVQLPVYNELYVAERVVRAAAALDYPADRLQIQVLDDSTDETVDIVGAAVAELRAQDLNIVHLQRAKRTGYKAGALQAGLASAAGDFIAIFDADFVPPPDFLKRALPYFERDDIAFVQTRWGHLNADYSLLTHLQALILDAHFMVEQFARSRCGYWFNFNGTAGIWRRASLEAAGGWTADTLTEDLDLSYRAMVAGWRAYYARDIEVEAELPVNFNSFRRQQHRWARGSFECVRKLLPRIWRSAASWRLKLQATLHLTGYFTHIGLFLLLLLYPAALVWAARQGELPQPFRSLFYFVNVSSLAPTFFFIAGQQQLGRRWWRTLPKILLITIIGSGLMLNTVRAAWQVFRGEERIFERTAKFGIDRRRQNWMSKRYLLHFDSIVYAELGLALLNAVTLWLAVSWQHWVIAFYATLFGSGLLFVGGLTLVQALALARKRRRALKYPHASTAGQSEPEPQLGHNAGVGD